MQNIVQNVKQSCNLVGNKTNFRQLYTYHKFSLSDPLAASFFLVKDDVSALVVLPFICKPMSIAIFNEMNQSGEGRREGDVVYARCAQQ